MSTILGSSVATKYQMGKFLSQNGVEDKGDLIDLYLVYGAQLGVRGDIAFAMAIMYTDYFKKEIVRNNLVGIGKQFLTDNLESFATIDDCILAQLEIMRTGADTTYTVESPHSYTYRNLIANKSDEGDPSPLVGNIVDLPDLFQVWKLADTGYELVDFWTIVRNMSIIRESSSEYISPGDTYYFVLVTIASTIRPLLNHKGVLIRRGFTDISIYVDHGYYRLEVGKFATEREARVVLNNLRIYGYNGYVNHRRKDA